MSEHFTDRFGFSYYDHGDEPWEDGMNKNFVTVLDNLLIAMWGYHARLDDAGVPEVGYYGGLVRDDVGDTFTLASSGVMPVTISVTNYFERDTDGVVYVSAVGFSAPSVGRIPMFSVDVDAGGVVTGMDDYRSHEMFGAGGGATELDDLTDVDTSGVSDGDVLTWDDATDTWIPAPAGSGGGGGGPTSMVAGYKFGAEADELTLSAGDPVSTWEDTSGNNYDLTETSTSRPTYRATDDGDGLPFIEFDGSNDRLSKTGVTSIASPEMTIFMVVRYKYVQYGGFLSLAKATGNDYNEPGCLAVTANASEDPGPDIESNEHATAELTQHNVAALSKREGRWTVICLRYTAWKGNWYLQTWWDDVQYFKRIQTGTGDPWSWTIINIGSRWYASSASKDLNLIVDYRALYIYGGARMSDAAIQSNLWYLRGKWTTLDGIAGGGGGGGGASDLADLGDVNLAGLSDGDVLTWDSGSSMWVPEAPSGGALALDDLTDVDTAGETTGDVLAFDGSDWVPVAPETFAPARGVASATTASLATGATDTGILAVMAGTVCLTQISSGGEACWVRLYTTAAARSADSARVRTTDPTPGTGVLAEFIFLTGSGACDTAPPPILKNMDAGPGTSIYWALTADEVSTGTYTITAHVLAYGRSVMSTASVLTAIWGNNSDAEFRAWGSWLHDAITITAGWTEVYSLFGTGTNWTDVTAPSSTNQARVTKIYTPSDGVTPTFYLKIEYGSGGGATNGGFRFSVGTGQSGGTLSNIIWDTGATFRTQNRVANANTNYFAGGTGWFNVAFNVTGTGAALFGFGFERRVNASGTPQGTGHFFWNTANASPFQAASIYSGGTHTVQPSGSTGSQVGPFACYGTNNQAFLTFAGNVGFSPAFYNLGFAECALNLIMFDTGQTGLSAGSQRAFTVLGSSHNYISIGARFSGGPGGIGAAGAMRYE